jgi:hypothetical protein
LPALGGLAPALGSDAVLVVVSDAGAVVVPDVGPADPADAGASGVINAGAACVRAVAAAAARDVAFAAAVDAASDVVHALAGASAAFVHGARGRAPCARCRGSVSLCICRR